MFRSNPRQSAKQPGPAQQTAILLRWLVWGVILVMLAVMLYRAVPEEKGGVAVPAPLPEAERPKLPVDHKALTVVEDNTRFRNEEKEAWFGLLDLLQSTPEETLQQASIGQVTWIQLFNQPEVYRGEPITLVGRVRRANRLDVPENEFSFEKYYQLWLQPRDNRDRVIVVYCLKLPKDFPLGLTIDEPVVLTGIFFKRWLYRGQADFELAPVFLANSLQWEPRAKMTDVGTPLNVTNIVTIIVVALVLSTAFFLFWHLRTRRPKKEDLPEEIEISDKLFEVKSLDEVDIEEDEDADEDVVDEE